MAEKYRIIKGFTYRGPDGASKKKLKLGPGEDIPRLDPNERERLLSQGKICAVSSGGENIRTKKVIDLNPKEIERILDKPEIAIRKIVESTNISQESLAKLSIHLEKKGAPKHLIEAIDNKMSSDSKA